MVGIGNYQLNPNLDGTEAIDTTTNKNTRIALLRTFQLEIVLVSLDSGPGVVYCLSILKIISILIVASKTNKI